MTRPDNVSPELWATLSEPQQRFVICHELMHVVMALRQVILDARADEEFDASTCDAGGIIFGDVASRALEAADAFINQN